MAAPATSASNILFSNVTGNSITLTWTNGNGANRLVLARSGSAVNANPVDLISYSASSFFGFGSEIGTGNFVVLNSNANTVDVTGLQPGTTYHFSVFEYNGNSTPVYRSTSPATGSRITNVRPSMASGNINFFFIDGASMSLNWTPGNGSRRIVVARAGSAVTAVPVDGVDYAADANFQLAAEISTGQRVVYDDASSAVDISGLLPNTVYHFRIYEYDGAGGSIAYLTTSFATGNQSTATTPTVQASSVNFIAVTGNSMTISFTNGNGAGRLVVMKAGSAVNADPVTLTSYNANGGFGFGTEIGIGNFVVANTFGNSVDVTNLQPGVTYHVAVYEYNGNSTPVYLTTNPARGNQLTNNRPDVASSNINFFFIDGASMSLNWTPGNGSRRIVVARAGAAVTAVPGDGVDYAADANFQLAAEISTGQRVVYDDVSSAVDISGLLPNTVYHFRIYEYNGTGSSIAYLTASFATGNQSSATTPTVQASSVTFSTVAGNSMTVLFTNGNGAGRLVVMKAGSAVNADPVTLTSYNANGGFGFGTEIGIGNFVVGNTFGNSVDVTNLQPGVTYHVAVYEYKGNSTPVYLTTNPARGNQLTNNRPTVASSNINFFFIDGASMLLNWTPGDGSRRIVVARAGNAVTAVPVDGVDYAENANFQLAAEISTGQRVVYDDANPSVEISGLLPNTVYHFRIYEYNGTGGSIAYLTTSFATGSQSTVTTPTVQSSSISFNSVTGNSSTIAWTNGNGTKRLVVARVNTPVNADPVDLNFYSGDPSFGAGSQIGTGNFAVANTTGTNVNVTGLASGTTYHFSVYEYNGNNNPVYLRPGATGNVTTIGAPQTPATNASAGVITSTTLQLTWTNGSGNRRLVLMKQGSAVNANPVDNGNYTSNSAFGSGTQLGTRNYVVYDATGNTVTVTGLTTNTVYHFAVFEYNSFGANSQFLITNPARGNATTMGVVPVTLLEFAAINNKKNIQLKWSTAQESNSSHFEIEKSTDGIFFSITGSVSAAGNSATTKDYSFIDDQLFSEIIYYRLKQVDLDNRFVYSKTIRIKYEPELLIKKIINPVQNILSVQLTVSAIPANSELLLYDMNGKLLRRSKITSTIINENISMLTSGIYVLQIKLGEKTEKTRLVKF